MLALTESQARVFDEIYGGVDDPWPSSENVRKICSLVCARRIDVEAHIKKVNERRNIANNRANA